MIAHMDTTLSIFTYHSYIFPKQALVFICLQYKSFENPVGKEKLLVTSNFSFPRVLYCYGELFPIFINLPFDKKCNVSQSIFTFSWLMVQVLQWLFLSEQLAQ